MFCPFCRHPDSRVVDSRVSDDGSSIRRRRQCPACERRFTTVETTSLTVLKRSGIGEPFSRGKVINGVRKACQGRPVTEDDLALLAQVVEEDIRASGAAEIEAHEVGLAILGPLQKLDTIAYLRFASVYQAFQNLDDFERAIATLRGPQQRDPDQGDAEQGGGENRADERCPADRNDADQGNDQQSDAQPASAQATDSRTANSQPA